MNNALGKETFVKWKVTLSADMAAHNDQYRALWTRPSDKLMEYFS